MKKYFVFAAAALVALASCSKVEPESEFGPELSFQAVNYARGTKALGSDQIEFYSAGTFGVYSYYTPGTWAATASSKSLYMNDVAISLNNGIWKNATTAYYWPRAGRLSFVGYYPFSADATLAVVNDAMAVTFSEYEVEGSLSKQQDSDHVTVASSKVTDDQNDLMVADFIASQENNNSGDIILKDGVAMVFRHLLAKVQFKAQIKNVAGSTLPLSAIITDIHVAKPLTKGSYNGTAWTSQSTPVETSGNFSDKKAKSSGATLSTTDILPTQATTNAADVSAAVKIGGAYYVMPQTLPDNATIEVAYTIYSYTTSNDTKTVVEAKNYNASIAVKDLTTNWAINNIYTYVLTIDPYSTEIYFDPAIEDWTDAADATKEID